MRACLRANRPGPYQIQAAIHAVHSDAPDAAETDWRQIVALYDQLVAFDPGPVVALNRAVAVAEVDGPAAGLALVDALDLASYALFHAIRADLLRRLGRRRTPRAPTTLRSRSPRTSPSARSWSAGATRSRADQGVQSARETAAPISAEAPESTTGRVRAQHGARRVPSGRSNTVDRLPRPRTATRPASRREAGLSPIGVPKREPAVDVVARGHVHVADSATAPTHHARAAMAAARRIDPGVARVAA